MNGRVEIREFLDESGKTVSHEVVDLDQEMRGFGDFLKKQQETVSAEDNDDEDENTTEAKSSKTKMLNDLAAKLKALDSLGNNTNSDSTVFEDEVSFCLVFFCLFYCFLAHFVSKSSSGLEIHR